jgi:S-adenosylmethionine hydrolase
MAVITFLTDFGTRDTYVGQMKGVAASIAPRATLIDLTHAVPAQDVLAGALEWDGAIDAFEAGTIHVGVIDPGVGSARQPIAIQTDHFTLVCPDNGLATAVMQRSTGWRAVTLTDRTYHRGTISATFHGRDVFTPVAAHLAAGVEFEALGEPVARPQQLDLSRPSPGNGCVAGEAVLIDHFGNVITNMTEADLRAAGLLEAVDRIRVELAGHTIRGLSRTFADVAVGEPVAYIGSGGRLEIAVRNGDAAATLGIARGEAVTAQSRL